MIRFMKQTHNSIIFYQICTILEISKYNCYNSIECDECSAKHIALKCTTQLSAKCLACGADGPIKHGQ